MRAPRLLRPLAIVGLVAISSLALNAAVPAIASASTPVTRNVLGTAAAKKLGFPVVVDTPRSRTTTQQHCTKGAEALYESANGQTGLVSDLLVCSSPSAATAAIVTVRHKGTSDAAIPLPRALGKDAFATGTDAPEYLIIWQHGDKVGLTALDTDVPASDPESASADVAPPAITPAQIKVLVRSAVAQNALLTK